MILHWEWWFHTERGELATILLEVPLYWAGVPFFHCTGLGSIMLDWEVPLYWARGFGLSGSIVLG